MREPRTSITRSNTAARMHGNVSPIGQINADGMHKFIAASAPGRPTNQFPHKSLFLLSPPRRPRTRTTHPSQGSQKNLKFPSTFFFLIFRMNFFKENQKKKKRLGGIDLKYKSH